MNAVIYSSFEEADIRAMELHFALHFNLPGYSASQWAWPKKHPTKHLYALDVDSRVIPHLHPHETAVELTSDWFPVLSTPTGT